MEAKDALTKIIRALTEIERPVTKQLLMDFLTGKETREINELNLEDMESFGIGDSHDEDYWTNIIEAACDRGFLKQKSSKSDLITPSPTGKKFLKKPTSFEIGDDEEPTDTLPVDSGLDELVLMAENDKVSAVPTASAHTKQQIKIIQAIDRKIALDDFAESECLAFDEVLDELENLVRQGRSMDITYFTDEVLGKECMDELLDFFKSVKSDYVSMAIDELGDVYSDEEIRLAYIVFLSNNTKTKPSKAVAKKPSKSKKVS